jgi:tetratricopeptide (TPR) repeat protein
VLRDHRPVPQSLDEVPSPPRPCQETVGGRGRLDSLDDAVRLHDLAVSRQAKGRPQEAVPLCRQALHLMEGAVGPHHPDVANILNTLAGLYEALGDYAEAERPAQRSMAIMEEVTGSCELAVFLVQSLGTLAGIYRVQGRYTEAEPLYRRALTIFERVYGPDHYEVAVTCNNLAALGPTHPKVRTCRQNYAQLLREKTRQAGAMALAADAV